MASEHSWGSVRLTKLHVTQWGKRDGFLLVQYVTSLNIFQFCSQLLLFLLWILFSQQNKAQQSVYWHLDHEKCPGPRNRGWERDLNWKNNPVCTTLSMREILPQFSMTPGAKPWKHSPIENLNRLKTQGRMHMYSHVYADISEAKWGCVADANYLERCLKLFRRLLYRERFITLYNDCFLLPGLQ